jgi:methionyl-tRNA formyltransferase
LPIYQVSRLAAPETLAILSDLQPEVACVACFPKRLPAALLRLPRWGCLNVHPSLLPQYRGPYPLFWTWRHGERNFGVTVHYMDEQFDTGDIAAQAEVELLDGVSGEEADTLLSEYGGECLVEVLSAIGQGTLARQPQPAGGSYFPAPQDRDFVIAPAWSARRAFNFMRGTNTWGQLYPIELAEQRFQLKQALFYAADEILEQPYRLFGDQIDIQFSPGVLRALIV